MASFDSQVIYSRQHYGVPSNPSTQMISIEAREAMNELDAVAEETIEDKRTYNPRRDYYETALDEVSEYGTSEELERFKQVLINQVKQENPPNKKSTYRRALQIISEKPPARSPLHRAG